MTDTTRTSLTRRSMLARLATALLGESSLLAGCGRGAAPPSEGGTKPLAGPKQLRLASWSDFDSPAAVKTREAFIEQFPGVEFSFEVTPWSEYINKQIVLMASGAAPDIVASENEQFPAFAKAELFKPLSPFFTRDRSIAPKDFFPQLNACYTYKGELYCLPSDLAPISAAFANKRLFAEQGLAMPAPEASFAYTWEQVVELARRLTKPDGSQYGLLVEYFETVPYSGGAYWVNDRLNPTRATLDDPRWARAIELWVDWRFRQRIMPTTQDRDRLGQREWWALFAQNKLAIYITGPWQIGRFLQMEPQLEWDMFWVPKLAGAPTRKFRTGGSGHGMTQSVRNPELAWEWLKFSNGKPGYEIGGQYVPPQVVRLRAHIPSTEIEVQRLKKLGLTNVDILVKGADDVLWWPFHPEWPRIRDRIAGPELGKALSGEVSPNTVLKDLSERITQELQQGH